MGPEAEGGDITLKDVEIAIKVIRLYLRQVEETQRLIRRLAPASYSDPRYELVRALMQAQRRSREEPEEEEVEEELTPEELERLRRAAQRVK